MQTHGTSLDLKEDTFFYHNYKHLDNEIKRATDLREGATLHFLDGNEIFLGKSELVEKSCPYLLSLQITD